MGEGRGWNPQGSVYSMVSSPNDCSKPDHAFGYLPSGQPPGGVTGRVGNFPFRASSPSSELCGRYASIPAEEAALLSVTLQETEELPCLPYLLLYFVSLGGKEQRRLRATSTPSPPPPSWVEVKASTVCMRAGVCGPKARPRRGGGYTELSDGKELTRRWEGAESCVTLRRNPEN